MVGKPSDSQFGNRLFNVVAAFVLMLFTVVATVFILKANPLNGDPRSIVLTIVAISMAIVVTIAIKPADPMTETLKTPITNPIIDRVSIQTESLLSTVRISVAGRAVIFFLTAFMTYWGLFQGMAFIDQLEEVRRSKVIEPIEADTERLTNELEPFSQDSDFRPVLEGGPQAPEDLLAAAKVQSRYREVVAILAQLEEMKTRLSTIDNPPVVLVDRLHYLSGIALDLTGESQLAEAELSQVSTQNQRLWPMSQIVLAKAYMHQGQLEKCKKTLTSLRRSYPANSTVAYLVGVFHFQQKEFKEAAIAFQECQGLEIAPVVFGDARIQDDYAIVNGALSLKLSGSDSALPPLSGMKTQVTAAIDRGRLRVQKLESYRRYRFLIEALSARQSVYDEVVPMEDYRLLETKFTKLNQLARLSEADRIVVTMELLVCIKESMQLLSQSPAMHVKYGDHEDELLSIFENVRGNVNIGKDVPESIASLKCELEVRNSLASIRCHKLLLNAQSSDASELYAKLVKADEEVSKILSVVERKGGKESARVTLGFQGMRSRLVGKALGKIELIDAGILMLKKVVDGEELDPVLPKESPYLKMFKKIVESSAQASVR